jgi:hypothetical protein
MKWDRASTTCTVFYCLGAYRKAEHGTNVTTHFLSELRVFYQFAHFMLENITIKQPIIRK